MIKKVSTSDKHPFSARSCPKCFFLGSDRFGQVRAVFRTLFFIKSFFISTLYFVRSCPYLKTRFRNFAAKKRLFASSVFKHQLLNLIFRLSAPVGGAVGGAIKSPTVRQGCFKV